MYAVIETGGKQYRVQPGDIIEIEKISGEVGNAINMDRVLMIQNEGKLALGKPHLSGANVSAEIVGQGRGEKILIYKFKKRKGYRRKQGHRQHQTQLLVTGIKGTLGTDELAPTRKSEILSSFTTQLKPRGEAFSTPIVTRRQTPEARAESQAKAVKAASARGTAKAATPRATSAKTTTAKAASKTKKTKS